MAEPTEASVHVPRRASLRERHRDETRTALLAAARALFTERGYHDVGIREVTAKAGVTRGAFYHHFADKEALFLAVILQINREKHAAAEQRRAQAPAINRWQQLRHDLQAALDDALNDPEFQRIRVIEAPAVLGWERWRSLDTHHGLAVIIEAVQQALQDGLIAGLPARPLGHLIWVALNEASMLIGHADHPAEMRIEAGRALDGMLAGLATAGDGGA